MSKVIFLILTLLYLGLDANDCVSFEGVKKKEVVQPIIKQLKLLGVNSKINMKNKCKYKIYLPIVVFVENSSGNREIEVHLTLKNSDKELDEKVIYIKDDGELYDLSKDPKEIRLLLMKEHSKIIAKNIKKEFF